MADAASDHHEADALVFFGATGDLAHKKVLPALYELVREGRLRVPVIGVAFSGWDLERFRARVRESVGSYARVKGVDDAALDRLCALSRYVDGDYADSATFETLREQLGHARHPLHYLAIPPSAFELVVQQLHKAHCAHGARVVVEKPFGRDLASCQELNRVLHRVFAEEAIFRIDHYLGKEETQNLLYFRFANAFVEPVWNRDHIRRVVVTMAEDFGVEGRGRFYEEVGALRDVVQNHLLQVVTLLAMEPPASLDAERLRDAKAAVFHAMRPLSPSDVVRGQYEGYRDEPGVAPESDVETYVALRLFVDSWRWQGVPWYVRTGKELRRHVTEVRVELDAPARWVFPEPVPQAGQTNYFRFQLTPRDVIAAGARVKTPGDLFVGHQRELRLHDDNADERGPYERLLGDALVGDPRLFARQDSVEAAWRVVEPVLDRHEPAHRYRRGSWGPQQAGSLLADDGGWPLPVAR